VYALSAIVVIALGIAINTVVFTATNALLLRPPGGAQEPDELVAVFTSDYSGPRYGSSSYPDYQDIRNARGIFESVAAVSMQSFRLSVGGLSARVMGEVVSPGYFSMLGLSPRVGRFFSENDPPSSGGVVISHDLWQSRYGGDNGVIGSRIVLREHPLTVIGVAPARFKGTLRGLRVQLWVSLASPASLTGYETTQRGNRGYMVIGRMNEGATLAMVQSGLDVLASGLHAAYPEDWTDVNDRARVFTAVPEAEARVPRQARGAILGGLALLILAVLMVLLVACTNVANMMLSRASVRRSEMGVRMALGATRGQIARHLLAESMLLAIAGGLAGVLPGA
jgi:putative ABC transport system permease protein